MMKVPQWWNFKPKALPSRSDRSGFATRVPTPQGGCSCPARCEPSTAGFLLHKSAAFYLRCCNSALPSSLVTSSAWPTGISVQIKSADHAPGVQTLSPQPVLILAQTRSEQLSPVDPTWKEGVNHYTQVPSNLGLIGMVRLFHQLCNLITNEYARPGSQGSHHTTGHCHSSLVPAPAPTYNQGSAKVGPRGCRQLEARSGHPT